MIELFFAVLFPLTIFAIALMAMVAVFKHIFIIIGILIALPFSKLFFEFLERRFNVEFPEVVKASIFELYAAIAIPFDELQELERDIEDRQRKAQNLINEIKEDIAALKQEIESLKAPLKKTKISVRTKKAMELLLGNPRWVDAERKHDFGKEFKNLKL